MALKRIGTTRDVVAFTLTGSSGFRTVNGTGQYWAVADGNKVKLAPGRYLIEGPPHITRYNAAPWTNEGDVELPAVVEHTAEKLIYCSNNGVLKITRL